MKSYLTRVGDKKIRNGYITGMLCDRCLYVYEFLYSFNIFRSKYYLHIHLILHSAQFSNGIMKHSYKMELLLVLKACCCINCHYLSTTGVSKQYHP